MTRPVDPLEARARGIASEFGVDPDSRIPMPDSHRTRPAWTDYREAARAEKQASKEAADLILLDDQFLTIIAAIEEGRGIFENVRPQSKPNIVLTRPEKSCLV